MLFCSKSTEQTRKERSCSVCCIPAIPLTKGREKGGKGIEKAEIGEEEAKTRDIVCLSLLLPPPPPSPSFPCAESHYSPSFLSFPPFSTYIRTHTHPRGDKGRPSTKHIKNLFLRFLFLRGQDQKGGKERETQLAILVMYF